MDARCSPATTRRPDAAGIVEAPGVFDHELALLAKALGHPTRVQIVRYLLSRDCCMCSDIVEHLPLAQSTVSQHLRVLKDAGILRGTIDGPRVSYCVEPMQLERVGALMQRLVGHEVEV